jgi:hypothetical protein
MHSEKGSETQVGYAIRVRWRASLLQKAVGEKKGLLIRFLGLGSLGPEMPLLDIKLLQTTQNGSQTATRRKTISSSSSNAILATTTSNMREGDGHERGVTDIKPMGKQEL